MCCMLRMMSDGDLENRIVRPERAYQTNEKGRKNETAPTMLPRSVLKRRDLNKRHYRKPLTCPMDVSVQASTAHPFARPFTRPFTREHTSSSLVRCLTLLSYQ